MSTYLSAIDRIIKEVEGGVTEFTDSGLVTLLGSDAPDVSALKNLPSFIFKLQRLGKKPVLEGDVVYIKSKDAKSETEATPKVRIKSDPKPVEKPVEPSKPEPLDPDFYWKPAIFDTIDDAIVQKDVVFLFGFPGCGKDEMLLQIGKKHNWETEKFELNGDMSKEDIFGFYEYKEGVGTVFTDGILPRSMKKGIFLIIDEMDVGPNEILMTMQKMLEKNSDNSFKTMYNPMNGEQVVAHEGFRLVATANTCGKGDETSLFPATHPLNDAFLDRFPLVHRMGYPDEKVEAMILRKTIGVDEPLSVKIAQLAKGVREAFTNNKLYSTFSLRRSKNFAKMIKRGLPVRDALKLTVLDRVSQEDARAIVEIGNRIFGGVIGG